MKVIRTLEAEVKKRLKARGDQELIRGVEARLEHLENTLFGNDAVEAKIVFLTSLKSSLDQLDDLRKEIQESQLKMGNVVLMTGKKK